MVADPMLPAQDCSPADCLPRGIPTQERLRECRVAQPKHIKLVNFHQSRFFQFQRLKLPFVSLQVRARRWTEQAGH